MALLNPETFEFVLDNELKRAVRSQNFVTLVMIQPRVGDRASAVEVDHANVVEKIARLINPELRETDLLAVDADTVWMVLLDADLQNSTRVIERVMSRLEHYQFTVPLDIDVGAACCPTHGAEAGTLKRAAAAARTRLARRPSKGTAHAQ
jgi:GGDEF domain-containing protein